jgi:hypothetical protein
MADPGEKEEGTDPRKVASYGPLRFGSIGPTHLECYRVPSSAPRLVTASHFAHEV